LKRVLSFRREAALQQLGCVARALLDFPHAQIEQDIAAAEIC
jgi:hypothetical protein